MSRGYNFGAGPAVLPESLLLEVQGELLNWQGLGMSVLEVGHRSKDFMDLMLGAEERLRLLLKIPKNYSILFLGGATRTHFSMVPINFLDEGEEAGYWITGLWSNMAYTEVSKLKKAYCIASNEDTGFTQAPPSNTWQIKKNSRYLYFTPNETVQGLRFVPAPKIVDIPLIADMTSCLLSEPINVSDYALIFAGAQKNIANAGLNVVIIENEFLNSITNSVIPTMFDYRTHCKAKSIYATPPTFSCYLAAKMFQWLENQGGVEAVYAINCKKAAALYDYIDSSSFYYSKIAKQDRSLVNVCFSINSSLLETKFLEQAEICGLFALRGHKSQGGLRASIYNAMPMEGVLQLICFMDKFMKANKGSLSSVI